VETTNNEGMPLNLPERRRYVAEVAQRYQESSKGQKMAILNEFVAISALNRNYASWVLAQHGRRCRFHQGPNLVEIKADSRLRSRRRRDRRYPETLLRKPLVALWEISGFLCSKRLVVFIQELAEHPLDLAALELSAETLPLLRRISPASIDRLIKPMRQKFLLRGRSHTRPGHSLMSQVPVSPYFTQNFTEPGHLQIDLVGHDGGNARGEFCFTLTATDPVLGWTLCKALLNKAQRWVIMALEEILREYPLTILELHSDCGSEFMNRFFLEWCRTRGIRLTRSRPGRKNDNCHVEQKNDDVVRKTVGYYRFAGEEDRDLLAQLYAALNPLRNAFIPSMKLTAKRREGARIIKTYDRPLTPYERLLAWETITMPVRQEITLWKQSLSFLELKTRQAVAMKDLMLRQKRLA
jgi:transposase InsO family protein